MIGDSSFSGVQVLERAPSELAKGHPTVYLGDVKLFDVKNALYEKGIHVRTIALTLSLSISNSLSLSLTSVTLSPSISLSHSLALSPS